jgi:bacteriocin biosynthesis cyclodehydratase domain-containing protein
MSGFTTAHAHSYPSHPILSRLYQVIPLGPDRVQLSTAGACLQIHTNGKLESILALLKLLDGTNTMASLEQRFPGVARSVVRTLSAKGLIIDAEVSPDDDVKSLSRLAHAVHTVDDPRRSLVSATVLVSGCSSAAAIAAMTLARVGIGRILLLDEEIVTDDEVSISLHGRRRDVGKRRSTCLAEFLTDRDSNALAVSESLAVILARYSPQLTILETAHGSRASDLFLATQAPCLLHWRDGWEAEVGPVIGVVRAPCPSCLDFRRLSQVRNRTEYLAHRGHRAQTTAALDPLSPHQAGIVGAVIAHAALSALVHPTQHAGRVIVIDLDGPNLSSGHALPVPGCPICDAFEDSGG